MENNQLIKHDGGLIKRVGNAISITNKLLALTEPQLIPYQTITYRVGIFKDIVGVGGAIALLKQNFKDPNKLVWVGIQRKDKTKIPTFRGEEFCYVLVTKGISAKLRAGDITLGDIINMTILYRSNVGFYVSDLQDEQVINIDDILEATTINCKNAEFIMLTQ